ncbi:hypothetical protein F0562_020434 [Nyssa sinensis]|uniref:Urease accessory protein UreH-like transmembrane domain-containing protein n=1 Tax=Nyssa sinensis TaxID=561372 RepID=A0A5J5BT11_9ASTE|nr:hypothetical protein F0562_020434 [Nyssa sinensis]
MERLIYSNTIASKIHPRPPPFLALFGRPSVPKLGILSSSRTESGLVNSLFCKHEDPFYSPSPPPVKHSIRPSSLKSSPVDSWDGLIPQPHLRKQIPERASQQQKAVFAGTVILVSALMVVLIHPVVASPAFAAFQTASKTGGPAAAAIGGRVLRTELLSSAWTGFFAGCLHTLSGPDHLAALAPLSIGRTRLESAAVGALWGCGHDAGQVIFGLLFLLLKDRLHIEIIRTWGTRVVGFTLLVIGAMGIREASEVPAPCVALENGECDCQVSTKTLKTLQLERRRLGLQLLPQGLFTGCNLMH